MVAAADIFAQNSPSDVLKEAIKTDRGAALVVVRLKARKNSFHEKMKHNRIVAIRPGMANGRITRRNSCHSVTPSMRAASRISYGRSERNECIIQITRGKFVVV